MKNLDQIINLAIDRINTIPDDQWELKPAPEKWSKKEILGHLVDSARNNLQRFTEVVNVEPPYQVEPYNQDQLVLANKYQQEPIELIKGLWVSLNKHIGYIMEQQNQENLAKPLILPDGTDSDLKWLMEDYIDHLEHHLRQIVPPHSSN
jgi:uncharacterized damage-inducible protein DinB